MVDSDAVVLKLTVLAPDSAASALQSFLRQWASSVDEVKPFDQGRDTAPTWIARIHTSEDKSKLPHMIQQKAFNRDPVRVVTLPTSEMRGGDPALSRAPMLFESEDRPIPFRASDLRPEARRVVPITRRPDPR